MNKIRGKNMKFVELVINDREDLGVNLPLMSHPHDSLSARNGDTVETPTSNSKRIKWREYS